MSKKMLIDAVHPEETRVVVMDDNRLEDFDFESKVKTSYKSNIYLAKVTRVEPSLQAAFVNYGGNRHGFLPFSEIHPDYYRIPIEDRERLMAEQEEIARKIQEAAEAKSKDGSGEDLEEEDIDALIEEVSAELQNKDKEASDEESTADKNDNDNDDGAKKTKKRKKTAAKSSKKKADDEKIADEDVSDEELDDDDDSDETDESDNADEESNDDSDDTSDDDDDAENSDKKANSDNTDNKDKKRGRNNRRFRGRRGRRGGKRYSSSNNKNTAVDTVGGDDFDADPTSLLWKKMRRTYKIQEVIKRGQVMLVQVQKEERGNKGAAVTTYITLPGRYGVLMPNSPRGGGISRKINWSDRKKLKDILKEVTIPKGMSVILRTAAVERTKTEIKRDLDYLYKLWDSIRELTLNSNAPALVYEEGQLVKRAIRDLYTRDVEEVIVAGEQAYKDAKEFMKMMIPSHAKRVTHYTDEEIPLFTRYHAESQIDEIYDSQVTLKSGGYLVIHPTEALISIDVNSGRSTKERNIEGTALRTNLETADEVARQLRLRDLGGLIVIDFIDMEDYRNNREVERRLTEALSTDRARVQIGRISNFGLMELSRQRLRPSLMETHFETCRHCQGAGTVRTKATAALRVIRAIEDEAMKGRTEELYVDVPGDIGMYILNEKRDIISNLETRHNMSIYIRFNDELCVSEFNLDRQRSKRKPQNDQQDNAEPVENTNKPAEQQSDKETKNDDKPKKGRRRKPRNKKDNKDEKTDTSKESADKKDTSDSKKVDKSEDTSEDNAKKTPSKPAKKAAAKKKSSKASDKVEDSKSTASNDDKPSTPKETSDDKKNFEVVNQAPEKKKKGWWNNILES